MSASAPSRPLAPEIFGLRPVTPRHVARLVELLGADAVVAEPDLLEPYARDETEALRFPPDVAVLPSRA
ncbi:MAG: hypothetical protein K8H90_08500 [Thermoanaerobaculia bacterium]|nr:hypothetical protein [Thermoanaerobaculia bacterium]